MESILSKAGTMPKSTTALSRVFRAISSRRVRRAILKGRHVIRRSISRAKDDILMELRYQMLRSDFSQDRTEEKLDFDWPSINYNRASVINLVLAAKPDARYLEIGCASNDTFNTIIAKRKIGVDPGSGGTHRMTSDEFFGSWTGEPFDVVFIDGLHTYEQAAKDIRKSLKILDHGGWILLHDMLPCNWLQEHVPQLQREWTGNVWKVAFELARTEGIEFKIFKIDYGVGVLRALSRNVQVSDLANELGDKQFYYLIQNLHRLPLVEYDEGRMWIRSQKFTASAPLTDWPRA